MLKKWPFLVTMLAMAGVANASTITPKEPDKDTNDGCYLISDADELYGFAKLVNEGNATACGKLDADITVNTGVLGANNDNVNPWGQFTGTTPSDTWTPIGTSSTPFQGSFDGQGHTISGLYFYQKSENFGLFGYIGGNNIDVTIKDLNISDSYFGGNVYVGSLVGHIVADGELTIENVSSGAAVYSHHSSGTGYIGGLIGYVESENGLNLSIAGTHNEGLVIGCDQNCSVHNYVGGLVGGTSGLVSVTVANSFNTGNITGSSYVGGLIGGVKNPTSNAGITLNITNAYNTGTIKGSSINNIGGLVGRIEVDYSMSSVEIRNCYNYGSVDGFAITNTSTTTLGQISFTPINCYYLAEESNGFGMSATDFADGTVFALLRSGEDGEVWRQYSGDAYPTFAAKTGTGAPSPMHVATLHYSATDSVAIPYTEGSALTLPTTLSDGSIVVGWYKSDDLSGDAYTKIAATENGDLNFYAKAMKLDSDGYYEIADADMLFKFAELVNTQNSTYGSAKVKLTADIVVNENVLTDAQGNSKVDSDGSYKTSLGEPANKWNPIGNNIGGTQIPFSGSFDGQGHTISGLYLNKEIVKGNEYSALFGIVGGEASVKNVGIEDSYFAAQRYVGGIVGLSIAEMLKIENCYNDATLYGINGIAGLVGELNGGDLSLTIENSYNSGTIKYDLPPDASTSGAGALVGKPGNIVNVINSYYLVQDGVESKFGTAASSTAFSDGTVAILLHGEGAEEDSLWGQKVGVDNHPNFYKGIDGSGNPKTEGPGVIENGSLSFITVTLHYSENATDTSKFEHIDGIFEKLPTTDKSGNFVLGWYKDAAFEDGKYAEVSYTQGKNVDFYAKIMKVVDNCYQIADAEMLLKFAAIVNGGESSACAKLTADITVNENVLATAGGVSNVDATTGAYIGADSVSFIKWTPIGSSENPFAGEFDGQGHTVSGLYFNDLTSSSVGLFGYVAGDGATVSISDVGVDDSYFRAYADVGGIVGGVYDASVTLNIENVYNAATVVVSEGYGDVGGIVGEVYDGPTLNITNAYNVGTIVGDLVGGIIGDVCREYSTSSVTVNNSFNYGSVACSYDGCDQGALVGSVDGGSVSVTKSFYLGSSSSGDYGTNKSASDFENGTVLEALRAGEGGYVWVQAEGDKYPTIDVNASTNAKTIVLNWTSAADSTTLAVAGYTDGAMVIVKSGKQFYAGGAIYEGILSAAQVAAIGSNKLYPISGVQLATDNGVTTATLDGSDGARQSVMIPTNVEVDRVVYQRTITANTYMTVMLPFDVDVENNTSVKGKYTFYKFCGVAVDNNGGYRYVVQVAPVKTFKANTPYIMFTENNAEGITFEKTSDKYMLNTTTNNPDVTKNDWTMHGVYGYKKWEEGDSELGKVFGFSTTEVQGYVGQFVEAGAGADIVPMRMYLSGTWGGPQGALGRTGRYNYASVVGPSKVIGVEIVDGEEETTTVKHFATVPTVVKANRWFDMKGRALNGKPTAKGTYYYNGQRVIIK